jgi:hypothetical protein
MPPASMRRHRHHCRHDRHHHCRHHHQWQSPRAAALASRRRGGAWRRAAGRCRRAAARLLWACALGAAPASAAAPVNSGGQWRRGGGSIRSGGGGGMSGGSGTSCRQRRRLCAEQASCIHRLSLSATIQGLNAVCAVLALFGRSDVVIGQLNIDLGAFSLMSASSQCMLDDYMRFHCLLAISSHLPSLFLGTSSLGFRASNVFDTNSSPFSVLIRTACVGGPRYFTRRQATAMQDLSS